jgi:transposase-like protein
MAKGQPVPIEIKQQIINQVKQGVSVSQLAEQNCINPNTIYNWLSGRGLGSGVRSSGSSDTGDPNNQNYQSIIKTKTNDALTIARLVKEKQELTEIIGKFAIQIEKLNSGDSKKKLNFRTG